MTLVSVVIPARTCDDYLRKTLRSIESQVLHDDVSVDVVVALADPSGADTLLGDRVRVVPNPTGTIPDGLNLAIAASSGDVVVRVDSRCVLQPDHIQRVLAALEDPQVGCVGGAALVLDRGLFGSTYAVAFNSMLLGPTVYRYRRWSGPADAAYLGAWRREVLETLGGFDPRMVRNQDNELSDRVRGSGLSVWYDADLVVGYYNARDLAEAVRHHHEFGLWRMVQRSQGQRAMTARHLLALAALGSVAGVTVAGVSNRRTRPWVLLLGVAGYSTAAVLSARSAMRLRRARSDLQVDDLHPAAPVLAPGLAAILDGAWLAGVLRGAILPTSGD